MTTQITKIIRPLDPQAALEAHDKATTGVHGVGESEVESKAGAQAKVDAHAGRTDNPHWVTAVQVGAVSKTGDTMMGPLAMASYALTFGNRFRLVYNSTLGTLDVEVI